MESPIFSQNWGLFYRKDDSYDYGFILFAYCTMLVAFTAMMKGSLQRSVYRADITFHDPTTARSSQKWEDLFFTIKWEVQILI